MSQNCVRQQNPPGPGQCWKVSQGRQTVQLIVGRHKSRGEDARFYFCDACNAWHTTSKSDSRPPKAYQRPSPGSRQDPRRWR